MIFKNRFEKVMLLEKTIQKYIVFSHFSGNANKNKNTVG